MPKSADAFRTISEVAEWLEIPAHVLRFWESKFSQVKPVKRAGGRRYYRPADMRLLGGIKKLLHDDGMTIKGVQKILREQGVKQVASQSQPLDELTEIEASEMAQDVTPEADPPATILSFTREESSAPQTAKGPLTAEPVSADDQDDEAEVSFAPEEAASEADYKREIEPRIESVTDADEPAQTEAESQAEEDGLEAQPETPVMPSFLQPTETEPAAPDANESVASEPEARDPEASTQEASDPPARPLTPLPVDVADDPEDDLPGPSGALTALATYDGTLGASRIAELRSLQERLRSLRG